MVNTKPQIPDTANYSISEASQILNISRTTLLRHTNDGFVRCKFRKQNKRKFYTGAELKRYWSLTY